MIAPLLEVARLSRLHPAPRQSLFGRPRWKAAIEDVSFVVHEGRSFGVVGESGAGKSTLARIAATLERPTSGRVLLRGEDLLALPDARLRQARRSMQMIFQDPYGSLDPRRRIGWSIAEPLAAFDKLSRTETGERVGRALEAVGIEAAAAARYPHQFSGGQRQRIAIARALVGDPSLVIADEPVSALDVSVQAQVLNLMNDLARSRGVTFLMASHDLAVIGNVCDDLAVMFSGRFVETGPAERVLEWPAHPYTSALVRSVPRLDSDAAAPSHAQALPPPEDAAPENGCPYASRCEYAQAVCRAEAPKLEPVGAGRAAACHFPLVRQ